MRYGKDVEQILTKAAACARKMGHSYVGTEQLLLALALMPGFLVTVRESTDDN
jgi:ATP-dependent Clp protease ATP-binding subunit ClpA